MAIYKRDRGFQLGTANNKSSKWPERDSNPGPPDCQSDAMTTRIQYATLPLTTERERELGFIFRITYYRKLTRLKLTRI